MATILIIQANPRGEVFLELKDEYLKIEQSLREVGAPPHKIVWESGVRRRDLLPRLRQHRPDIVHFSGHGDPDNGEILFEDRNGETAAITPRDLTDVFRRAEIDSTNRIKLVVLNSCFSKIQAEAVAKVIPVVIGTTTEIEDDSALRFSELFYAELGRGFSIQKAVDIVKGDLELRNEGINRIIKVCSRASEGASKIKLFRRPEIRAEFDVVDGSNRKLAKNGNGEYCVRLWVENAPDNVIQAIYQFNHRTFKSQFVKGFAEDPGGLFPVWTSSYGNIQIRVALWSLQSGYCFVSTLSDALKLTYAREKNKKIRGAVDYIANH
jgi:hypothetical protein